ncbi:MAG: zinc metallopeptidase [Lachnospiraceae bacterium]|nr:zinc metallopeptidase [Lachnospiraceae bacterium]
MDYFLIEILLLISVIIAAVAQSKVSTTFSKYSKVASKVGLTGAEVAERILHSQGIYDVNVVHIPGNLTDNYNSSNKTLSLSDSVYNSRSVAAISVAAHESGHAIQHATGYGPLTLRHAIFPAANIGSKLSMVFIVLGVFMGLNTFLIYTGIILFSLAVMFQVVTLPVEFDASNRALQLMNDNGILYTEENSGAKKVLSAAALTYVAATITAVLQLLRLVALYGGRRRD